MTSFKFIIFLIAFISCASSWQSMILIGEKEKDDFIKKLISENKRYKIYILDDAFYEIKYKDK